MIILNDLPEEHELRNTPLGELHAGYFSKNGSPKNSRVVSPSFGIAKRTYNELGKVWTDNEYFAIM